MTSDITQNIKSFKDTGELIDYLRTQQADVIYVDAIRDAGPEKKTKRAKLSFERHMNPDGSAGGFIEKDKVRLEGENNIISTSAVVIGSTILSESSVGENADIIIDDDSTIEIYKSKVNGSVHIEESDAHILHSLIESNVMINCLGNNEINKELLIMDSSIGTPLSPTKITAVNTDLKIINSQVERDISISFSRYGKFDVVSSFLSRKSKTNDSDTFTTLTRRLDSLKSEYTITHNSRVKIGDVVTPKPACYRWVQNMIEFDLGGIKVRDTYYIEFSDKDDEKFDAAFDEIKDKYQDFDDEAINKNIEKFSFGDKESAEILRRATLLAEGVWHEIHYENLWSDYVKAEYIDKGQHVIPFFDIIKNKNGVCHEKALVLEKLIEICNKNSATKLKIKSEIVEGNVKVEDVGSYGHAWVEVHLPNGKNIILDPTNKPYLYGTYEDTISTNDGTKVIYERDDAANSLVIDATPTASK
jgi:hypothetical protein